MSGGTKQYTREKMCIKSVVTTFNRKALRYIFFSILVRFADFITLNYMHQ